MDLVRIDLEHLDGAVDAFDARFGQLCEVGQEMLFRVAGAVDTLVAERLADFRGVDLTHHLGDTHFDQAHRVKTKSYLVSLGYERGF